MDADDAAPVVVGVDGSDSALSAVRLAAGEAARRGVELHIVHAYLKALINDNVDETAAQTEGRPRNDAERVLAEAAAAARATEPGVAATTRHVRDAPTMALLNAARDAQLLVIGNRGLGGFSGLLLGSVAVHLTSRSLTPVLVARGEAHPAGGVVVGVDEAAASRSAVEAAFAVAQQRGAELLAVRAWTPALAMMMPLAPIPYHDGQDWAEHQRHFLASETDESGSASRTSRSGGKWSRVALDGCWSS
ncbi:universal stress protein [Catellatospora bangladeshensis]|uniref:universal stress protein n=1 Tax=Catellatospora bangladeshensis TaxID=310355 RepID=UPI00360C2EE3